MATRADWKSSPLPAARESLALDRTYSDAEFERLRAGVIPEQMEDKWFFFYEEPWLYLHRSWTGIGLFQVRFEPAGGGGRVAEALVSRDTDQYKGTSAAKDSLWLAVLLDQCVGRDTAAEWERYKALP